MQDGDTEEASTADQADPGAMVDQGTREAMVDQGTREAMAGQGTWETLADVPPPQKKQTNILLGKAKKSGGRSGGAGT